MRTAFRTTRYSALLGCLCLLWAQPAFAQDLHEAVDRKDVDEVIRLIAGGADVNERDISGYTPLHAAVRVSPSHGNYRPIEIAEALVRAGADVGIKDEWGRTALHLAASALNYEGVDFLLRAGSELTPDIRGRTPLHVAVWSRALSAHSDSACSAGDPGGQLGCYYDAIVRRLLAAHPSNGLVAHLPSLRKDEDGRTPLHGRIRTSEAARALFGNLPNGRMPDAAARDHRGRTPWFYVDDTEVFRVMRELLESPVFSGSLKEDERGRTPLHFAENERIVRAMLEADPALIEARDTGGWTPLHRLARHGSPAAIGALLAAGANANAEDDSERTPIYHAANHVSYSGIGFISHTSGAALYYYNRQRALSIIESLLEAGARTDIVDRWGSTPLHSAARWGSVEVLQALLKSTSSGSVNEQDNRGHTALHGAALNPIPEAGEAMVRTLLEAGADPTIRNAAGRTALDQLQSSGPRRASYASVIAALESTQDSGTGTGGAGSGRGGAYIGSGGRLVWPTTEISVGSSMAGRISAAGEVDRYRFALSESVRIVVYTTGSIDTFGRLNNSGSDDDSGADLNFRIEARLSPGNHFLEVSGFCNSDIGDYTLHVLQLSSRSGVTTTWTNTIGMEFVAVPAGNFLMGSPESEVDRWDDETQHEVRISRGFWMGKHEVTQGQWEAVMGENPSYHNECGVRCPVERVSWVDVQEYIRRLNEREAGSGNRYRLPTEAEWEYAARSGTVGARYGELDEIAWYVDNSGLEPHPVGEKGANAWGLHDMLGNVGEWTGDWYGAYPGDAVTDPTGSPTGAYRVGRGGGWADDASFLRSAIRDFGPPSYQAFDVGFRLVRTD